MIMFMPEEPQTSGHAGEQAVAAMPGSFGKWTFLHAFKWVREKGYETDEHFQQYHARLLADRNAAGKPAAE